MEQPIFLNIQPKIKPGEVKCRSCGHNVKEIYVNPEGICQECEDLQERSETFDRDEDKSSQKDRLYQITESLKIIDPKNFEDVGYLKNPTYSKIKQLDLMDGELAILRRRCEDQMRKNPKVMRQVINILAAEGVIKISDIMENHDD